jgi:FAD dependent oxidoreductase
MAQEEEPKSTSSWLDTVEMPEYQPLNQNLSTDVCVIGAGIAGLTTAYILSQAGKRVVVLDKEAVGGGQTGLTTAHCSNVFDDRFAELVREFGSDITKLVVESHTAAIDFIEKTAKQENIECEFERVDGYLFVPPGTRRDVLSKEGLEKFYRLDGNAEKLTFPEFNESFIQVSNSGKFPDTNLLILSRTIPDPLRNDLEASLRALQPQLEKAWDEMQVELAKLSTKGKQLKIEKSGHFIQNDQPQAVIDGIRQILALAKTS